MDTKSKILFGFLGVLIILSVSASYYRFMVLHDYLVEAEVECDPTLESCFVWECDSEEEECTGNPDEDTWYYKIAYRNAKNIPACDVADESCDQFTCPLDGEAECSEVLCSTESLDEHHIDTACTVPENFVEESLEEEMIESDNDVLQTEEVLNTETPTVESDTTETEPVTEVLEETE